MDEVSKKVWIDNEAVKEVVRILASVRWEWTHHLCEVICRSYHRAEDFIGSSDGPFVSYNIFPGFVLHVARQENEILFAQIILAYSSPTSNLTMSEWETEDREFQLLFTVIRSIIDSTAEERLIEKLPPEEQVPTEDAVAYSSWKMDNAVMYLMLQNDSIDMPFILSLNIRPPS